MKLRTNYESVYNRGRTYYYSAYMYIVVNHHENLSNISHLFQKLILLL